MVPAGAALHPPLLHPAVVQPLLHPLVQLVVMMLLQLLQVDCVAQQRFTGAQHR
jgi:hypothetical protein